MISTCLIVVISLLFSSVHCNTCKSQSPDADEIKPKDTTFPVMDLVWLGKDDRTVIATTKRIMQDVGGLWISNDGADSWVNKTQVLVDAMQATINEAGGLTKVEPVEIIDILPHKSAPSNILLAGSGSFSWISTDAGQTFKARLNGNGIKGSSVKFLKVHPWLDTTALTLVKRPGCKSYDSDSCPYDLLLTHNLYSTEGTATSWVNLTEESSGFIAGFVDAEWTAALCPGGKEECQARGIKDFGSDLSIMATFYRVPGSYDEEWDPDLTWGVSATNFKTIDNREDTSNGHKLAFCGNLFQVVDSVIYLAFANSCPTDIYGHTRPQGDSYKGVSLYTSINGGESFTKACVPVAIRQDGFEMFSTQDGRGVDLVVDFEISSWGEPLPASSVYTAGPHHAMFSLSLPDVYRANFGYSTDFSRIEGLPGVWIANQIVPRSDTYDDQSYEGDDSPPLVQTRISFNGGGRWQPIDHSNNNFNYAKCNRCAINYSKRCFLHLRGVSSYDNMVTTWPAVYSSSSAVGYILATGVVAPEGYGLEDDTSGVCTWLSTNGGVTWQDVADESMTYEFADFGGTIVMAKHPGQKVVPATEVKVSTDGGNCWTNVPLSQGLFVENIKIEPDGQRSRVIVYGVECDTKLDVKCTYSDTTAARKGVMYTVDFQSLDRRLGPCVEADYEHFSVPNSALDPSPKCILGKVMKITRRIPGNSCLNGPSFVRPAYENTTCACTLDDVECEYGYVRTSDGCTPIKKEYMPTCPYISSGQYKVSSSGLRVLHADVCTGIDNVITDTDGKGGGPPGALFSPPPPHVSPDDGGGGGGGGGGDKKKGSSGAFVFGMILLTMAILGGLFAAWWVFAAQPRQKDMIKDGVSSGLGLVSIVIITTHDNIKGIVGSIIDRVANRSQYKAVPHEQDMSDFQPLNANEFGYSHA